MTTHKRGQHQTAISVSMTRDLVAEIDERAAALNLNRSQYLAQLVRNDLKARGDMVLRETPPPYGKKLSSSRSAETGSLDKVREILEKELKSERGDAPPEAKP